MAVFERKLYGKEKKRSLFSDVRLKPPWMCFSCLLCSRLFLTVVSLALHVPAMPKRSSDEVDRMRRSLLVPGASEEACQQIWSIIKGKPLKKTLKRQKNFFLQPFRRCLERIPLQRMDGNLFHWPIMGPSVLKQFFQSQDLTNVILEAQERSRCLHCVLYHDDATAGNVLSALKQQKCTLFYLSFLVPGLRCCFRNTRHLDSVSVFCVEECDHIYKEDAWICVGLLRQPVYEQLEGGLAQAVKLLLQTWMTPDVLNGFSVPGFAGQEIFFKMHARAYFISDLDALKYTFHLKGSSSLRPCFRCKNICTRRKDEISNDRFFRDISCASCHEFSLATDAEVFEALDFLSGAPAQAEEYEKALGLTSRPHNIWCDPLQRHALPPSHVLGDPFHIFWSNGIMSAELNLFYAKVREVCKDPLFILKALLKLPWEKAGSGSGTVHVRNLLQSKMFQGTFYKGSAQDTEDAMALFWYAVQEVIEGTGLLKREIGSMRAAVALARCLRTLKHQSASNLPDSLDSI